MTELASRFRIYLTYRTQPELFSRVRNISDAIDLNDAEEQLIDANELFDMRHLNYTIRCTDLLRQELLGCRWPGFVATSRPDWPPTPAHLARSGAFLLLLLCREDRAADLPR